MDLFPKSLKKSLCDFVIRFYIKGFFKELISSPIFPLIKKENFDLEILDIFKLIEFNNGLSFRIQSACIFGIILGPDFYNLWPDEKRPFKHWPNTFIAWRELERLGVREPWKSYVKERYNYLDKLFPTTGEFKNAN